MLCTLGCARLCDVQALPDFTTPITICTFYIATYPQASESELVTLCAPAEPSAPGSPLRAVLGVLASCLGDGRIANPDIREAVVAAVTNVLDNRCDAVIWKRVAALICGCCGRLVACGDALCGMWACCIERRQLARLACCKVCRHPVCTCTWLARTAEGCLPSHLVKFLELVNEAIGNVPPAAYPGPAPPSKAVYLGSTHSRRVRESACAVVRIHRTLVHVLEAGEADTPRLIPGVIAAFDSKYW